MASISIQLDGDGCWPDLTEKHKEGKVVWHAELSGIALLPDGEVSNSLTGERRRVPVLTLRFELPDGSSALAQVKLEMLQAVVRAMNGRLEYLAELKSKGGTDS